MFEIQNADRDRLCGQRDVDCWVADRSQTDVDGGFLAWCERLPLAHGVGHLGEDVLGGRVVSGACVCIWLGCFGE